MSAFLLLFLPITTWAAFAPPAARDSVPPPSRFELPNGLRVWMQEDHRRPVALVQITYNVGSLHERAGQTGVAHYVEHMVYRATEHIRNEDVYGYIDRIGGRYTGGTWPEFTRYAETVPAWALESALRVTAERMCCALFDSTEFERERHNVVTEANGFAETDPLSAMRDAMLYAAFDVHPYRLNSNSWARDNLALTRDDAYAWYKRYYGPNNAVLVIVGDVDTGNVRTLVTRHFGAIPRAPAGGAIDVVEPPQRAEKRVLVRAPRVTPELDIVYRAPGVHHADFPVLAVVTHILRSRLPRALTGAGVPSVVSVADSASEYPYVLRIVALPDSSGDVERVLDVIDAEIQRLGDADVTDAELNTARVAASGNAGPSAQRSQSASGVVPPRRSYLSRIADDLTDREAQPWQVSRADMARARAAALAVRAEDVRAYAARWLRRSQRTVGMLRDGADEFVPTWTDGRALAGDRMQIPPLTTPPAPRLRPEPVPARALQPLAPIGLTSARRALANGIVVRAARVPDTAAHLIRIACDCADTLRALEVARALRGDPLLARRGITVRIVKADPRDSSAESIARARAVQAVNPAASYTSEAVYVGVVSGDDARATADQVAGVLRSLPPPSSHRSSPRASRHAGEERIAIAGARQVVVVAALPGVERTHPDRRALELLAYIAGVPSYGGRLGWALTKTGLTYSAAATNDFGAGGGAIVLGTECDTRNTDATIQAIREIVEGIGTGGVEEWELREAQAFMLGRTLLYGAREDSDPAAVAAALNRSEETGVEQLDPPALSRAYLSITLDEINRIARAYYRPERLHVVAAGAIPVVRERIFPPGTFRSLFVP